MTYSARLLITGLMLSALLSCRSVIPEGARPTLSILCDSYLIYDMCVQDFDDDGVTDVVFFENTRQVFLYQEGFDMELPDDLSMHRCPRPMDESLLKTTSRIFFTDEHTTLLEKTDIKGALLIDYIRLTPEVVACNLEAEKAEKEAEQARNKTDA